LRRLLPHYKGGLAAFVLLVLPACSGAATANFVPGPNSSGGGSSGSGSGGESGSSGGYDATMPSGSGGSGRDGSMPDDSSTFVPGLDGESDAMPSGDATADAGPPGVLCPQGMMASRCAPGETCCITTMACLLGSTQTATCQASTCTGTPVHCSSQADCKQDEICCGTETTTFGGTSYQDVSCSTTCTSAIGATRVQFCDPSDTCPAGTTCQTSTIVQGYTVCR
jgi:hypothetical protein